MINIDSCQDSRALEKMTCPSGFHGLGDDGLMALVGREVPSTIVPGVRYLIERLAGEGGMALAFVAWRLSWDGMCPVVLKVLRPRFFRLLGPKATLSIQKEAVALGRLNERTPTTPFVVRLIDVGTLKLDETCQELPWIAVEYVDGGTQGTTLTDRVQHSILSTGSAFDPRRASHAIECLASGLTAVHEVGVIHRDITPDNVLCCGCGEEEIFKVADFGVARPAGVVATFGGISLGTLGYAPPELILLDRRAISIGSDVFSFAAVCYFLLTGEDYFHADSVSGALMQVQRTTRRSVLASDRLSTVLRSSEHACRGIDQTLARATSGIVEERPTSAASLAASLLPWLRPPSSAPKPVAPRTSGAANPAMRSGWTWVTCQNAEAAQVVKSVAWESDGCALAATNRGLSFWNGASWRDVPLGEIEDLSAIRFVHRIGAGQWLLGNGGTLATCTTREMREVQRLSDPTLSVQFFSGDLDDLGVAVCGGPDQPITLHGLIGHRWLRPLPVLGVTSINSIARVGDAQWLLAGRTQDGTGVAAIYSPLDWEVKPLPAPSVRAYLACAARLDLRLGVAVGTEGAVIWHTPERLIQEEIDGKPNISAVAIDSSGYCWAAGSGRLWVRETTPNEAGSWSCVWQDPSATAPIVSLIADPGFVTAVTAGGAIIQGRAMGRGRITAALGF